MERGFEQADVWILFDVARGLLGLRRGEEIWRHALLSSMGATGASFALHLERESSGRVVLTGARGFPDDPDVTLSLSKKAESALTRNVTPRTGDAIRELGPVFARFAESHGVELLAPHGPPGRLDGLVCLGTKIFAEAFLDRDVAMVEEIVQLAALAERSHASPHRGSPSAARSLAKLRETHPVLREFRGEGVATAALLEEVAGLAEFDLPVLILGETGTGKELVARAIHELSPRRSGSFEAINCAAIPPELMASALFGHERGAFTGAVSTVRGAFERAGNGTIFLDEIGDMPPDTQASLLRVLQERRFRRVGGEELFPVQARVISATNRDLAGAVDRAQFRPDLFYRLQMYSLRIPPLRHRRDEIPLLAEVLLERHAPERKRPRLAPDFLEAICERELQGNVRELESLIVSALVRAGSDMELRREHLAGFEEMPCPSTPPASATGSAEPASATRGGSGVSGLVTGVRGAGPSASGSPIGSSPAEPGDASLAGGSLAEPAEIPRPPASVDQVIPSYESMEREYVRAILRITSGNKKQAAELMGIPRTTLNARIKKLRLQEPPDAPRATGNR